MSTSVISSQDSIGRYHDLCRTGGREQVLYVREVWEIELYGEPLNASKDSGAIEVVKGNTVLTLIEK